ncbi:phosphoribosyltransferase family protein [Fodinibius sp. N2]|uniref:phosphoribosyltransferase family protein n=1 Tax=Fodinibius alkaliphilus TaxID=3140241 RepID=UPI00315A3C08
MGVESQLVLMSRARMVRSLNRIAHEIVEQNIDDAPIYLFGINKRGYIVAEVLNDILKKMPNSKVRLNQLMLNADTLTEELNEISLSKEHYPIIVDDVIFSGKTMFSALKTISEHLQPAEIHTAVLIDRGHRKFPIKAEFCGKELPTKLDEHVSVEVEGEELRHVILQKQ